MSLHWDGLLDLVAGELARATDHVYVLAPFIQLGPLRKILPTGASASVVTSWREDHLISGIASPELFRICRERDDVALYIHPNIHLKLYARDITRVDHGAMFGSANVTANGLDDNPGSNRELLSRRVNLSIDDRVRIQRIVAESILVDEDIYNLHKDWLEEALKVAPPRTAARLPKLDLAALVTPFLVTNLPLSLDPNRLWKLASGQLANLEWWEEDALVHDLALFGATVEAGEELFMETIRQKFFDNPFIAKIDDQIDSNGVFFGAMKVWIQDHCDDVPAPRRRDLTLTVQSLMRWFVELAPDQYEIVRPRHSECLRRR